MSSREFLCSPRGAFAAAEWIKSPLNHQNHPTRPHHRRRFRQQLHRLLAMQNLEQQRRVLGLGLAAKTLGKDVAHHINKNTAAPSVTIAPRTSGRGSQPSTINSQPVFVATLTTQKDVRSYPVTLNRKHSQAGRAFHCRRHPEAPPPQPSTLNPHPIPCCLTHLPGRSGDSFCSNTPRRCAPALARCTVHDPIEHSLDEARYKTGKIHLPHGSPTIAFTLAPALPLAPSEPRNPRLPSFSI